MDQEKSLPVLSAPQIRVLGALIEKSKTTPDYYPLTINALTAACNQKTSRNPVTDYSEDTVRSALGELKAMSLVATAVGGGSRTLKYKHNFNTVYDTSEAELALLCLLFLRGPQTPGELNTNSARLYDFKSLEQVITTLEKLCETTPAFVKEMPKRAGQKETRFMHLLGDLPLIEDDTASASPRSHLPADDLNERVTALEQELQMVKADLARIMKDLF